jgi:hypothetical protein
MAQEYRLATSRPFESRLEHRLVARTVQVLRDRRVRRTERVRRAPREQDFVEVVEAAMALDVAAGEARRPQGGLRRSDRAGS